MAEEISVSITLNILKGTLKDRISENDRFDLSAASPVECGGSPSIGTGSHEALPVVDITTAGWGYFKNLDSTNYVEIGRDSGGSFVPLVKLLPGEFCVFRVANNAVYAKANTAACRLKYRLWDA